MDVLILFLVSCLISLVIIATFLGLMSIENKLRFGSWIDHFAIRSVPVFMWAMVWLILSMNIWVGQLIYLNFFMSV